MEIFLSCQQCPLSIAAIAQFSRMECWSAASRASKTQEVFPCWTYQMIQEWPTNSRKINKKQPREKRLCRQSRNISHKKYKNKKYHKGNKQQQLQSYSPSENRGKVHWPMNSLWLAALFMVTRQKRERLSSNKYNRKQKGLNNRIEF